MPFQTIPINIAGPSYQSRSMPLSSQQTINWYQQFAEEGKEQFVLMPFPGLKEFGSSGSEEADRGMWRMKEVLYQVKGTSLYRIDTTGTHTDLGNIPGTERCIMADDGINLFIVTGGSVYHYNSDNGSITKLTDPNIDGAISVDFINNQFLYTKPNFTSISNVGDGTTVNPLNVIGAETRPDDLVRDFVFEQTIWRFGVRTTEAWYNSGAGNPPIDRIEGQILDVGLTAIHSVAETDEAVYWLGDDKSIYRLNGGAKERISTDAISEQIRKMPAIDDAVAYTFTIQGQNFYLITFPYGNRTFVLNESLGNKGWFELSSGIEEDKYQGSSLIQVYNKNIVADESNGKLYELDLDTFTNDGNDILRKRVTGSINGKLLGQTGKRVLLSRLEMIMETGVGLISGQGENPRIMIEASYDGGRSWSAGTWARVGRLGEYVLQVEWFEMVSFYDCILRITSSDPVNYSIYSATVDIQLAGR